MPASSFSKSLCDGSYILPGNTWITTAWCPFGASGRPASSNCGHNTLRLISRMLRLVRRASLMASCCLAISMAAHATVTFTAANIVFPSTPVGQSTTQTVTVTLNSAVALKSIVIPAEFTEYTVGTITGCTIDSSTVNGVGTICKVPVIFTPRAPGSTVSPSAARTAPLQVTDIESGNPVMYSFGLMGAATGPVMMFTPATLTRIAGAANTTYAAGDQGLGSTASGYAGGNLLWVDA